MQDRFNNPFINHELMSISLNSTSKWKARNMPSFLAYIEEQKQLPKCLTMSLAAYIAFYSSDIQERTADGLICKRPAGNTYKIQDDAWALDFYYAHKDDTDAQLVHAVLTNTQMWDQDLTKIEGLEAAVLADLELIRTQGCRSCLQELPVSWNYHLHNKGLLLWAAASLCFVNVIKENNYAAGDSYQPH